MYVLETHIRKEQYPKETEDKLLSLIKEILANKYVEFISKEIQNAYLESYHEFGQNMFDRYIAWADAWVEDIDYKDPDTGQMMNRAILDVSLQEIEKPSGIVNTKDFRNEVVKFALRSQANNSGKNPSWTSFEKIRTVIEKKMFGQVEDLLPVISFGSKKDTETSKKHHDFVERMMSKGYTERQVRRLVEWYMRVRSSA
jgi:serine protein kinase